MKKYILTGSPGSGKTTLLHVLKRKGYAVVEEAATDVIALEHANGILEPWADFSFIHKILQLQIDREHQAPRSDVVVFDRSPICTYALCIFLGHTPPTELMNEINRITAKTVFQQNVFFIEPTQARQISFDDALRFEEIHRDAYQHFGYTLINLPNTSVDTRLNQLIQWIS